MDVFIPLVASIAPVLIALGGICKLDSQTCWHLCAFNAHDGNFNFNLSPGGAMQMHVLITCQAPPLKRLIAIQWSASVGAAAAATCITLHHWMQLLGIA